MLYKYYSPNFISFRFSIITIAFVHDPVRLRLFLNEVTELIITSIAVNCPADIDIS